MTHTKPSRKKRWLEVSVTLALVLTICIYFTMLASAQNRYNITDGDSVTQHMSSSTDIDQVLAEADIALGPDDLVTASQNGNVTDVTIQRNQNITVSYAGEAISTTTYDTTVGELLTTMGLSLTENDVMLSDGRSLTAQDKLYDGMNIDITTTQDKTVTKTLSVPYESVTYQDPTLAKGTTTVKTQGVDGKQEITYREEYVNGELVNTSTIHSKLVSAPVTEVILVGSGAQTTSTDEAVLEPEPEVTEAVTLSGGEAAQETLSQPEAVSETTGTSDEEPVYEEPTYEEPAYEEPAYSEPEETEDYGTQPAEAELSGETITTSGGQVLTYVDVLSVEATAYCGGGTTATGTPARYGAIAVDPDVIPYGTRMYIVSDDGNWIYGEATAEDCGGAINGNIIDLYFDSYNTCIQFGRRNCTVYILEWG